MREKSGKLKFKARHSASRGIIRHCDTPTRVVTKKRRETGKTGKGALPRIGQSKSDLNMSDFEDANPFGDDNDHLQSPSSPSVPTLSTETVPDDDEREQEPPPPPVRLPQHRQYPGLQPKTGFCCSRDEYLHSGDDAEIQVKTTSTSHSMQQAYRPNRLLTPSR